MTRRMIRQSALGVAAFAVLALVLGTLQVFVSPASSEMSTTVAYAADFVDAPGAHLTEVAEGTYAWAPDAQHIANLEAGGATVLPVAHQSLTTADGVAALSDAGASVLFLGESFYKGFLNGEVVAAMDASGLHLVTVRASTFAMLAPGTAEPRASMNLKMVDVAGEPVPVAGWATPVEAVVGSVDAVATREDGGVVVGSVMVGDHCVSLFGIPWGSSTAEGAALLGAVISCRAMTDEVPAEDVPADEVPVDETPVEEIPVVDVPADEVPVDETPIEDVPVDEVPADEVPDEDVPADAPVADDGLVDLPLIIVA